METRIENQMPPAGEDMTEPKKYWKFGSINVRTMKDDGKAFEVTRAIHEANLDIVGLQEIKRLQYGEATIQVKEAKYQLYWQGHSHKREAGVGILIKSCNYIRIEDVEAISPRLMIVKLFVHNTNLKFIVAYAPTEDKSDEIKNEF